MTDVTPGHDAAAEAAGKAYAAFNGNPAIITEARDLLGHQKELSELTIRELKQLLLADDKRIARNLAKQLAVYATGAPVGFADREEIEGALARASSSHYGVRSLVHEIVQSELFRSK